MLSYCLKCRIKTESKNQQLRRKKTAKIMLLSKCVLCLSKISKFIKEQEASGLSSSVEIKTLSSVIPLVGLPSF